MRLFFQLGRPPGGGPPGIETRVLVSVRRSKIFLGPLDVPILGGVPCQAGCGGTALPPGGFKTKPGPDVGEEDNLPSCDNDILLRCFVRSLLFRSLCSPHICPG